MSTPLLSILIPATPDRNPDLSRLLSVIKHQLGACKEVYLETEKYNSHHIQTLDGSVFISILSDDKVVSIGEKREDLYKLSNGLYSWQIDSDDSISPNAIELILNAIRSNPEVDCITFEEHIDFDGKIQRSNHSLKYGDWADNFDGFDYVRTPFMKSVIRTDIAQKTPIVHCRFGEDHLFAKELKKVLKTEVHIDQQLYHYIHRNTDFNERYGIK